MKRIVILGAGESGAGAAVLAKKQGFDVFVSDFGEIKDHYKQLLDNHHIPWEEKQHSEKLILNAGEVIKSPGIPDKAPIVKKLIEKKIPVISEIEFAGRYTDAKMICITGSNGKTTTTMLIYHILKDAGLNASIVYGTPDNQNDFDMFLAFWKIPTDPDQYFFWHSTQAGRGNIVNIKNVRIDKLLEDGRKYIEPANRKKEYLDFQKILVDELPAAFLYYPYSYTVTRK